MFFRYPEEFREGLKKPFVLKLRQHLVPWRPGIIVDTEGSVYFHSLLVGRHKEGTRSYHLSKIWKLDPDGTLEKVAVPDLRRRPKWPDRVRNRAEDRFGTLVTIAFTDPVAWDPKGNLSVADPINSRIRKVTSDGVVTTVAGGNAAKPKGAESFVQPSGVAVGPSGDLYVLDGGQKISRVRKIFQDGKVQTLVVVDGKTGREGLASEQRP